MGKWIGRGFAAGIGSAVALLAQPAAARSADDWRAIIDLAEFRLDGRSGFHWESAIYHDAGDGDLHFEFDGDGDRLTHIGSVQLQGLYETSLSSTSTVWIGAEHDRGHSPSASLVVGGCLQATSWFYGESSLFVGSGGQMFHQLKLRANGPLGDYANVEPRLVLDSSVQRNRARHEGGGPDALSLSIRIRLRRDNGPAPYLGFEYSTALGKAAGWDRADGEQVHSSSVLLGFGMSL